MGVAAVDADLSTLGRVVGLGVLAISIAAIGVAASTGRFRSLIAGQHRLGGEVAVDGVPRG